MTWKMGISTVRALTVSLWRLSSTVVLVLGKQSFCRPESWKCPKEKGKKNSNRDVCVIFLFKKKKSDLWTREFMVPER